MSVPTTAEIALLQSRPHNTKLWLSIYQPDTVLACQVSGTHSKGDRSISYDSVTAGSYLLVEEGMTMFVGSAAGLNDFGKIRVRSADASQITVAENSHIDWTDNFYLTIVRFFEINAVYPRIVLVTGTTTTLWYKDYDITYTDQNTVLGSFVCMGGHYAGFTEDNVYYTASGTYNLKSEALSYFWFFQGADTTGSNAHTPGYITYSTPGQYTTRLIVSGTASADVSYRHISIYDRPDQGTNNPILEWRLIDISGDRDAGGHTASIRVYQSASETLIRDGSLVVIYADDWYAGTEQSIGGNNLNRSSIVMSGYILNGSIVYNYADSHVEFDIGSPTTVMKDAEGFSISVEDSEDPSTLIGRAGTESPSEWTLVLDLDVRRAIYHYLRWHSTVLKCADIEFKGTDKAIQYFDSDRSSIYDAINTLMQGALVGNIVADRQGKIWLETDIYTESTSYETNMGIQKRDWLGSPLVEQKLVNDISWIEAGGIDYNRTDSAPLIASAPGEAPNYRGGILRIQGLALEDQAQLNTLVGNMYANKNAKYPNIDLSIAGNYRNFDIAPQEIVPLTISQTDTTRGISFSNKSFYIKGMRWTYDHRTEVFLPKLSLHELTTGFDGDTMPLPPIPPADNDGFGIPPIQIPPIPPFPIPTIDLGGNLPFFIPALGSSNGWVEPNSSGSDFHGISLSSSVTERAYGTFVTPPLITSTSLTIYAIIDSLSGGGGSIVCANDISWGGMENGEWFPYGDTTGDLTVDLSVSSPDVRLLASLTIPGVGSVLTGQQAFLLVFTRKGGDASDTHGTCVIYGWYLIWE